MGSTENEREPKGNSPSQQVASPPLLPDDPLKSSSAVRLLSHQMRLSSNDDVIPDPDDRMLHLDSPRPTGPVIPAAGIQSANAVPNSEPGTALTANATSEQ